ncbi:hypothetical protein PAXRUDRAFT_16935 [Paxillus rubicundulus Ve08.2h10]|uniref:Ribonuclease H n=1 Tax=Paxillus rubicundulus Ve08.2h10 TaxID=930991 RepID=A0A0D0D408_9AGAM|nr:hypothetical protein PAXRUDRAFT_16935 [Paxillus rubicundulus Ve08.2h10]
MPKASKYAYYAVRKGRVPGIYMTWSVEDDCDAQVNGFAGAVYKKLHTEAEAREFIGAKPTVASTSGFVDAPPIPSMSLSDGASDPKMVVKAVETVRSTAKDEMDCDIVYCDGSCKGNGQPGSVAGIGVWWGHGDPRNIAERCPGGQTNNRAELIAIVRILETAPPLKRRLLIKTDSKYSIQCVSSWIFKWMSNGFLTADGKPVKNRALIKYLAALLHARRTMSQTVEFKHVRGHVGIEGNEAADQLANVGETKSVLPERDWEKLEAEVLQNIKLAKFRLAKTVDGDPKAYADGSSDDTLTDKNIGSTKASQQRPKLSSRSGKMTEYPPSASFVSTTPVILTNIPPPKAIPTVTNVAVLNDKNPGVGRYKLPSGGSSVSASVRKPVPKLPPPKPTAFTKEDLEAYASCLLDDDESVNLGEGGIFNSEF